MIGFSEIPITKRSGFFHCPGCRETRPYKRRTVYRFLTIYFVPLVPLEVVSEHARCNLCREQFPIRVLEGKYTSRLDPPSVNRAVILAALRATLIDDRASQDELVELQRLIWDRTGIRASRDDILAARHLVVGDDRPGASHYLRRGLGEKQQERAVRDLFVVVSADRHLRAQQLDELTAIPQSLRISEAKFRRLVLQATSDYSDAV